MFHPFFILFLVLPLYSSGSYSFNSKVEKAYQEFIKLRITNGHKIIDEALKEDPDNGLAILIANFGDVISVFISEDKTVYNAYKIREEQRLKKIESLSSKSPYYLFTQAEIKIQWAFVKLKFGDEVSAGWNVKQAFKLLEQNTQLYPDFINNKKTLGLLKIVFGSIPDKYVSIANLAGLKGDIQDGMKDLEEVAKSDSPFATEALIYKILAENYILKKQPVNLDEISKLYHSNKDNLLFTFIYSSLLIKNTKLDDALIALKNRPTSPEYFSFPYLDFLTGEIYLFKAEYKQAETFYQKFLHNYNGKNFIKDGYYKIFLCYWLSNNETEAKPYLQKILTSGQAVYDPDKHAQKFAMKNEMPDKTLMKSRLYFDGGYYEEALVTINSFQVNTSKNHNDIIEYNYRKGRIYHQMNNNSQAIIYYLKTIELSKNTDLYFAPNSALQMGYIYKDQNNKELARLYFNKALSYQNYEYKNSIDNKAKAALNELKAK